jgi:hypothetical protein
MEGDRAAELVAVAIAIKSLLHLGHRCSSMRSSRLGEELHRKNIAGVSVFNRGNVDAGDWAGAYPKTRSFDLRAGRFYVLRDLKALQVDPIARGIDVVVSCQFPCAENRHGRRRANSIQGARGGDASSCPSCLRRSTSYRTECDRSFAISATCDPSRDRSA